MEPHDVDQFLDEVLGRGRVVPPGQPPAARPGDVIVLRPGAPPPPQRRAPQRRPQRVAGPRAAQPRRGVVPQAPPPQPAAPRSAFSQSIQQSVDRAADATGSAGAAAKEAGTLTDRLHTTTRAAAVRDELLAMLNSPADIRRAILLREILGPPLALRRRKL